MTNSDPRDECDSDVLIVGSGSGSAALPLATYGRPRAAGDEAQAGWPTPREHPSSTSPPCGPCATSASLRRRWRLAARLNARRVAAGAVGHHTLGCVGSTMYSLLPTLWCHLTTELPGI
jgi:hypothetical protein